MTTEKLYEELDTVFREPRLRNLYRAAEAAFREREPLAHNWEHVKRDLFNAVEIGLEEGADMSIVIPAILLHDIGYVTHPDDPHGHPGNGARDCAAFLEDWDPESRERIASCVLKHKGKFPGFRYPEPETLEERVVSDADQTDKFGWIGLLQMVKVYVEYSGHGIERFKSLWGIAEGLSAREKIVFYTESGARLAEQLKYPDLSAIGARLKSELSKYREWREPF